MLRCTSLLGPAALATMAGLIGWLGAAEPPTRPMILHGVALIHGAPATKGTILTLSVDGQPVQASIGQDLGQAHYWVAIPPAPTQPIRFISLGENNLGAMPTVAWQAGTVRRQDVLVNCELTAPPQILSASARVADGTWTLDCQFARLPPTDVGLERITYVVRWHLLRVTSTATTEPPPQPTLLAESQYPGTGDGTIASTLTATPAGVDPKAHLLRLVVGTELDHGHSGPPDVRVVPVVVTAGQL